MAITVAMAITIAMAIARPGAKMVALRQMDAVYACSVFQDPGGAHSRNVRQQVRGRLARARAVRQRKAIKAGKHLIARQASR